MLLLLSSDDRTSSSIVVVSSSVASADNVGGPHTHTAGIIYSWSFKLSANDSPDYCGAASDKPVIITVAITSPDVLCALSSVCDVIKSEKMRRHYGPTLDGDRSL